MDFTCAGFGCKRDNLRSDLLRQVPDLAGAATSAIDDMATTRSTEVANRIGQMETNIVSERAARLDAEQDVTVPRQRTRDPSTQMKAGARVVSTAKCLGNCTGAGQVVTCQ